MNWRGRVLESREVVVNLIASTTTRTGLTVRAELDHGVYQKGIKATDHEMKQLPIIKHKFHGDWNYTIKKSPEESERESD
jgi:Rhodopirellula transposase DDE domain